MDKPNTADELRRAYAPLLRRKAELAEGVLVLEELCLGCGFEHTACRCTPG